MEIRYVDSALHLLVDQKNIENHAQSYAWASKTQTTR